MSEPMIVKPQGSGDLGEVYVGVMDCIFALGVAMANAGVLTRQEIAEALEEVTEQQESRPDCQHPARQYPAKALATLFRATVVTRLS